MKFLVSFRHIKEQKCEAVVEATDIQKAREAVHTGEILEECEVGQLENMEIQPFNIMAITDEQFDAWKIKRHSELHDE